MRRNAKTVSVQDETTNGMITMNLHPQEAALVEGIRRMRYGTIEKLGIHNGLPDIVMSAITRLDLKNDIERKVWCDGK
jgi:hypothetical protein